MMPKFFEYDDPELQAHVDKIISIAFDMEQDEDRVIARDPIIYPNNNRDKPFPKITEDDIERRFTLAAGGGKDKFVVAKHREEQKAWLEEYFAMQRDRDGSGNFEISHAQTAKIAQIVKAGKDGELDRAGFFAKIKAAVSLSKEARREREKMKVLKKAIKEGESHQ